MNWIVDYRNAIYTRFGQEIGKVAEKFLASVQWKIYLADYHGGESQRAITELYTDELSDPQLEFTRLVAE